MKILRHLDRRLFFFTGPALSDMDGRSIRATMLGLCRYAEAHGYTSLISLARDYPYAYDWGGSKVHLQHTHEFIIALDDPWERVVGGMRKSIPEQARKAARSGVTFATRGDASTIHQLLRLIENTRSRSLRKTGSSYSPYYIPYLDLQSLRRLGETRIARFFTARSGSDILCVLLAFVFSRRAYALLIGTSEAGYRLRAPAFVWFNAILELQSEGVLSLNLAGGNAFAKTSLGAESKACTGSVSPYLKGPIRNLLFQTFRWADKLRATTDPD